MNTPAYCPICGQNVKNASDLITCGTPNPNQHRCKEKTLRGIDATLNVEERKIPEPSFTKRLEEGFKMLDEEDF